MGALGLGTLFGNQRTPITTPTITNVRFGFVDEAVTGFKPSFFANAGKFLGVLGSGLGILDGYNRLAPCLDLPTFNPFSIQSALHGVTAEDGLIDGHSASATQSLPTDAIANFVTAVADYESASISVFEANEALFGAVYDDFIPQFDEEHVIAELEGGLAFVDLNGNVHRTETGEVFFLDEEGLANAIRAVIQANPEAVEALGNLVLQAGTAADFAQTLIDAGEQATDAIGHAASITSASTPNSADIYDGAFFQIEDTTGLTVFRGRLLW